MILYPAIDIRAGRAVRLVQGDYSRETAFDADPLEAARRWVEQGAEALHVVDLDGARAGSPANLEHSRRICVEAGVPVQLGGGLRDAATVDRALEAGVERVVIGTAALRDPEFLRAAAGVPVLGICLGLQLVFTSSTELGGSDGLGLVEGPVEELRAGDLKLPHIGWSPVFWAKGSRLTEGLAEGEPFYFVHSFVPRPADEGDVLGTAEHGERFACAIERGNVFGVQFHPEKSSGAGLRQLRNCAAICAAVPSGA